MPKRKIRLVIDTIVWVSFLIGKTLSGLSKAIIDDRVTIFFSGEFISEVTEVLRHPKFQKALRQNNHVNI